MSEIDKDNLLVQLQTICLAFPEAIEDDEGVGSPSFKVRKKIFAMRHFMHERPALWCKAPAGAQAIVVSSDPQRFFIPPYVGQHGWIGIWLDVDLNWEELADLINESYRMIAPKRLLSIITPL